MSKVSAILPDMRSPGVGRTMMKDNKGKPGKELKKGFSELHRMIAELAVSEDYRDSLEEALENSVKGRTAELVKINDMLLAEIVERKKAEEELRSLKKAVETMQLGVTIADVNGKILYTNLAEAKMHGYEVEELIGKDVRIFAPAESWNRLPVENMRGVKSYKRESINVRKDGSYFPVQLLSDALINADGQLIGIATYCEDITERKRLAEELLKINKLESVGTLAAGIAHDFNNILTLIMSNISLAKMQANNGSKIPEMLSMAEKGCRRAQELTHQLLTFSKGGEPIRKEADISELIKESADLALSGSNARVEYSFPDGLWPVEVDEGQINQVINNLILNAEQAMPEGGTIEIHAENISAGAKEGMPLREGKYVKISVKDQGIGIPAEHLHKIFDPYFTTKEKGSGLGLATSYSIVKKHNGYITVELEKGVGTTFYIYLPASEKEPLKKEKVGKATLSDNFKILIMDDEEMLSESIANLLGHMGYMVETARDGTEAIELYKKAKGAGRPFDVVVMDLTIPGGMGGKEAIKRLRGIDPDVKAVVSSGYSSDSVMADFASHGFNGVVVKPYRIEELVETLNKVIKEG